MQSMSLTALNLTLLDQSDITVTMPMDGRATSVRSDLKGL